LILSFRHVYTRKKLSDEMEKAPSTISFHLKRLIEADVVEKFHENGEVKYRLKDEPAIDKLLIQHKDGLLDDLVVTFYDYYLEWSKGGWLKLVASFLNNKKNQKLHDDIINEIFPHPYWG
jgi:DNA-binding transcriptional ArsR family regulator